MDHQMDLHQWTAAPMDHIIAHQEQHKVQEQHQILIENLPSYSDGQLSYETCEDCGKIVANDWLSGQRLKIAANQMSRLIRINADNQCDASVGRLKTIFRLYRQIIDIGPLDDYLGPSNKSNQLLGGTNQHTKPMTEINLLETRQQVLFYIENLSGYCDSINKLRMILKSTSMINIIDAYSKVIDSIRHFKSKTSSPVELQFEGYPV